MDMDHHENPEGHAVTVVTDEDDRSTTASEEDQSTGAGEDATSDVPQAVVPSSRPQRNPILSPVTFHDPGDPEDPDDKFLFPSATYTLMRFTDANRDKCHADGTRKNKKGSITLSNKVKFQLCRWMCLNHYLHEMPRGACRTTLDPFKQCYNLHDPSKDERARQYFGNEIDECARRFSNQVKKEKGFEMVLSPAQPPRQRRVVRFKNGYD